MCARRWTPRRWGRGERARYPAEIVQATRAATGERFVISYRFSQFKEVDYGAMVACSPEELQGLLTQLRAAGVDLFNVSTRRFSKAEWPDSEHPDLTIAEWTRRLVDAPVILRKRGAECGDVCESLRGPGAL